MRHELTHPLRKMPLLQKPATVEGMHPDPDEPGCIPDVVEPRGRNKIGGFVGLEDRGNLFRFSRHTLCMGEAIGQAGKKLAGKIFSGWRCLRSSIFTLALSRTTIKRGARLGPSCLSCSPCTP